jgi:hypothetical protein
MTTPTRLAYLAGALDYNNSIRMVRRRGRTFPMIHVTNSSKAHIRQFVATFGGGMAVRANGMFVFQRSHASAVEIVRKIRPHIRINTEVADQVLEWLPEQVKPNHPKVPCPNGCGNGMTPGSKSCQACYLNSLRASRKSGVLGIVMQATMPASMSMTGSGEITRTATGLIHRLRG